MLPEGPVLLYGYGAEGRSTHHWLTANGWPYPIVITGDGERTEVAGTEWLGPHEVAGALTAGAFASIVKSPGVSLYKPIFDVARRANVPITSNLNLWADRYRAGRTIVAITGTKGKSTTTDLVWRMLRASGINADLAGNGGTPFLDLGAYPVLTDTKQGSRSLSGRVSEPDNRALLSWKRSGDPASTVVAGTVVMELSSYQTADMDFAPDVAGIVNLSPEHTDWHLSTAQYYTDKLNLIDRKGDFAVALGNVPAGLVPQRLKDKQAVPDLTHAEMAAVNSALAGSNLLGRHNRKNAKFAARIALAAGASLKGVQGGIAAFEPLPHRLEPHLIGKKLFIDDSISTTPVSTLAALDTYVGTRMALIGGGGDRGQDYSALAEALASSSVAIVVCLPVSGVRLAAKVRSASGGIEVIEAADLEAGMVALAMRADQFETVLLSPGAPSQGQALAPGVVCRNFAQRGDLFVELARQLFGSLSDK
jgi:UDP-N-acetylmuramoylalanine-D-glutamate ligase